MNRTSVASRPMRRELQPLYRPPHRQQLQPNCQSHHTPLFVDVHTPADYRAGTADERGEGPERRDSEPRQTACKGMLANIRSGATVGGVLRYNQEGMQLVGRTAIFRRVTTDTRADSLSGRAAGFAGRTGFPT